MTDKEYVNTFNREQQHRVYMDYLITQLGLKYDFYVTDIYKPTGEKYAGLGKPDMLVHNSGFYWLWKNNKIYTFDEFLEGDKLYEWYWRFKNRIGI
jgi:hypothetical protein